MLPRFRAVIELWARHPSLDASRRSYVMFMAPTFLVGGVCLIFLKAWLLGIALVITGITGFRELCRLRKCDRSS